MSDLTVENRVVVRIFGEEYPITGANDPKYISRIADLVDSRMKEVSKVSRSHARDKVAILAAMSIASELHEKGSALQTIEETYQSRLDSLLGKLDHVLQQDPSAG